MMKSFTGMRPYALTANTMSSLNYSVRSLSLLTAYAVVNEKTSWANPEKCVWGAVHE